MPTVRDLADKQGAAKPFQILNLAEPEIATDECAQFSCDWSGDLSEAFLYFLAKEETLLIISMGRPRAQAGAQPRLLRQILLDL